MHRVWLQFAFCLPLLFVQPSMSAELVSDFDETALDTMVWNDCQLDGPPLIFVELTDAGGFKRRVLQNVVGPSTGNKDTCNELRMSPDGGRNMGSEATPPMVMDKEMGSMGPSLIDPSPLDKLNVAECPKGAMESQRNELRLQMRPDLVHDHTEPHWYSMTFHVDGQIPSCGSSRWVLAQWKQEKDGPNPFLAQRFDNGVLHVTVQNGACRCLVATAETQPDIPAERPAEKAAGSPVLSEFKPTKCLRTDLPDDAPEERCEPIGLRMYTVGGAQPPPLPDPKRDWVRMTYHVRNGFDGRGRIDVYAGKQFIARMLGAIGYKTSDPGMVKFKFGQYRNRIDGSASLSVDRLCLSRDVAVCAPDLDVLP